MCITPSVLLKSVISLCRRQARGGRARTIWVCNLTPDRCALTSLSFPRKCMGEERVIPQTLRSQTLGVDITSLESSSWRGSSCRGLAGGSLFSNPMVDASDSVEPSVTKGEDPQELTGDVGPVWPDFLSGAIGDWVLHQAILWRIIGCVLSNWYRDFRCSIPKWPVVTEWSDTDIAQGSVGYRAAKPIGFYNTFVTKWHRPKTQNCCEFYMFGGTSIFPCLLPKIRDAILTWSTPNISVKDA